MRNKRFVKILVIVAVVLLVAIAGGIIAFVTYFRQDGNEVDFSKELNIDTSLQYKYDAELNVDGNVEIINGVRYIFEQDYIDKYNLEENNVHPDYDDVRIKRYYIENVFRGCSGSNAVFGENDGSVHFVLSYGKAFGTYADWYIDENYVFPDTSTHTADKILIMDSNDYVGTFINVDNCFYRIESENAVAVINDTEIINDVIKNENYDLLNDYVNDDNEYFVLAHFDGHIVYETITVLNYKK